MTRLDEAVVEAAWLYYADGLNQSEIAARLAVSRASVVNYLQEARARGWVRVSLDVDVFREHRLARELVERFGLADALVAPSDPRDARRTLARVARAAGDWLPTLLAPGDRLGVAWGETVFRVSEATPRAPIADLTVVQLVGSRPAAVGFAAEACAANIARQLGAHLVNLPAPLLLGDAALAAALRREPVIAEQLAAAEDCNKTIFAAGACEAGSHIVRTGVVTAEALRGHVAEGARAVICGRLIDAEGRPVRTPVEDRMIGVSLDRMRDRETGLLVSSGPDRVTPMRAALRGGFATHVATCAETAAALLAAG